MEKKSRLKKNTIMSMVCQIVTLACGLILPRMILEYYNSEVNGLVNSISRFLSLITFMEFGICSVIQSALYKPLAYNDTYQISKVVSSASKFFRRIARVLFLYVIILVIVYPFLLNGQMDFFYTATLIGAMSISYFAQYYFGLVDQILLQADQKGYLQYTLQTVTVIVNTVVCILMIRIGVSIQVFKLVSSLVYLLRPLILRIYVSKNYQIDRNIKYTKEPIEQKWNGIAQQISAIVLGDTDVIVLTLFSTLSNVSIYSVYNLVVTGVKQLIISTTNGIQSLLGELCAKGNLENIRQVFKSFEWVMHAATVFVFGCTGVLILPFVRIYTLGVTDINYIVPTFSILITIAHATHCLRLPYNILIMANNHYKQTQANHIMAAAINILVSVITVKLLGLVGVAIGTLAAMTYQTIWMAWYVNAKILKTSFHGFFKQIIVDVIICLVAVPISRRFSLVETNYFMWCILAIKVAFVWFLSMVLVNFIAYHNNMSHVVKSFLKKIRRKK